MKKHSSAWIFVSHSVHDLETVRKVRNYLEEQGANPILFFLKCVSEEEELDGLLKREIAARNFFLLCDSENARSSRWVREEVEYVKSLPHKPYREIDVHANWEEQKAAIDELLKISTVYISYRRHDALSIRPYVNLLRNNDFTIFLDLFNIKPGDDFQKVIYDALRGAAENGFLVQFLTLEALQNPWMASELKAFLAMGASARLILVDLEDLGASVPKELAVFHRLPFYRFDIQTNGKMLMRALGVG
ncbi:MAG: toll/interleukin-1 receptor domain-containing protein [Rhodomicrobium sp.]